MKLTDIFKKKNKRPFCSAVIVAAGSGERMGNDKMFLDLCGKPVLLRAVIPYQNSDAVDEIVIVTRPENVQKVSEICSTEKMSKVKLVIEGGATRTESALAGVSAVSSKAEIIAVHDGARPFVSEKLIEEVINCAAKYMAAVPALPSTDTVKIVDDNGIVIASPDRSHVVSVQTPQAFNADILKGALSSAVTKGLVLTDDCAAVEMMGAKVHTVNGDSDNIKITYPDDLVKAEAIIRTRGLG